MFGLICLTLVIAPMAIVWAQSGGSLDLRSNVIAGGGNTSTGSGNLQISGTIGQPAAGTQTTGGTLTQTGGFWPAILGVPAATPTPVAGAGSLQFSAPAFSGNEGCAPATITVTRTNGSTGAVTVDFASNDGTATQARDYELASGTLAFGDGETSKTLDVLITKDAYTEGNETVNLALSNATGGAALGAQTTATLTIIDDATVPTNSQPIDDAATFVCQHYHDFLARTADSGGAAFWTSQITNCGSDQTCIRNQRIVVSNSFYFEQEFQQTGTYVYRLYRAAFGNTQPSPNPDNSNPAEANKVPSYAVFMPDRARVPGGPGLPQAQLDLANAFVQRPAFVSRYPASLAGSAFIDAVTNGIKNDIKDANGAAIDLSAQKSALLNLFNQAGGGNAGRAAVIYRLADDNVNTNPVNNRIFIDAEYNRSFVATQYYGYLRRDADIGGFLFWLGQVSSAPLRDTTKQHSMVCSFITSGEYENRFSALVTHTNAECTP